MLMDDIASVLLVTQFITHRKVGNQGCPVCANRNPHAKDTTSHRKMKKKKMHVISFMLLY